MMTILKKSLYTLLLVLIGMGSVGAVLIQKHSNSPEQENSKALSPFEIALNKGYAAMSEKRVEEAKKYFVEASKLDPESIFPWLGLADAGMIENNASAIVAALKKASELGPYRPEPIVAQARYQYSKKEYDEAEKLLLKAVQLAPGSPVAWVDLGDLYSSVRKKPSKAMEYYRKAIDVAPRHGGANFALGTLLMAQGDPIQAIAHLEVARDIAGSGNPLPALALGNAFFRAKKWKSAQEAFSRAISIQPDLIAAYLGRASAFIQTKNIDSAINDLLQLERLDPNNPEIPFKIGALHQDRRAFNDAFAAYEKSSKIDPKFWPAYNNLAWLAAIRRERLDEAVEWIRLARELNPTNSMLFDTQGWLLRARGDLDGARAVLSEGIAIKPSVELHYHLGVVLMEKGLKEEATVHLRKALQIKPDFPEAKDTKERLKQLEKAK